MFVFKIPVNFGDKRVSQNSVALYLGLFALLMIDSNSSDPVVSKNIWFVGVAMYGSW